MTLEAGHRYTQAENLRTTADFLNIKPDGVQMETIFHLRPRTLRRILKGTYESSRSAFHMQVLGDFSRSAGQILERYGGKSHLGEKGVVWLETGKIRTQKGLMSPLEALSDSRLAMDAAAETAYYVEADKIPLPAKLVIKHITS